MSQLIWTTLPPLRFFKNVSMVLIVLVSLDILGVDTFFTAIPPTDQTRITANFMRVVYKLCKI